MTVLFFSRLFYPHIGGVEKHVLEVSRNLIKRGHKVIVVTEKFKTDLGTRGKINGIEVYRIPVGRIEWLKKFRIWIWLWEKRKLIEAADIVHCHDVFFWYFPFRFLFPKKPIFTTFHGYESYPISKKAIWIRKISEELSFGTICIGSFMRKWYGTKPKFISYGGVNIVKSLRSKIKSQKSAVFVGRLDEQTGVRTYVEAIKSIRKKIPDFEFIVVGDGKFKKEINKEVEVLGFKRNPEKYLKSYRFAFVSRYLSILEAMAAKRLVFAVYNNPLKKDYLTRAPFAKFINVAGSKEELSAMILNFLKYPKKEKRMVDKAFEWAKDQSWEKIADLYLTLWKRSFDRNHIY